MPVLCSERPFSGTDKTVDPGLAVAFLAVLGTSSVISAVLAGARAGAEAFPVIASRKAGRSWASPFALAGLVMIALALFCRSHRARRIVPVVVLLILVVGYGFLWEEHLFDILSGPAPLWFAERSGQ
jgi:uncharacterized membrane protein (UPF0136 family)